MRTGFDKRLRRPLTIDCPLNDVRANDDPAARRNIWSPEKRYVYKEINLSDGQPAIPRPTLSTAYVANPYVDHPSHSGHSSRGIGENKAGNRCMSHLTYIRDLDFPVRKLCLVARRDRVRHFADAAVEA